MSGFATHLAVFRRFKPQKVSLGRDLRQLLGLFPIVLVLLVVLTVLHRFFALYHGLFAPLYHEHGVYQGVFAYFPRNSLFNWTMTCLNGRIDALPDCTCVRSRLQGVAVPSSDRRLDMKLPIEYVSMVYDVTRLSHGSCDQFCIVYLA